MTLVLSFLSREQIVQVSDRRVTLVTGPQVGDVLDDDRNKIIVVHNRFVISYSGLAEIGRTRTDEWIVTISRDVRPYSPKGLVNAIRQHATIAFRGLHIDPALKRHAFVLAGWVRLSPGAGLAPIVIAISNALDQYWQWRDHAADEFTVIEATLSSTELFSLTETGARLSHSQNATLQRELMACVRRQLPPLAAARLLANAIRDVSSQNTTVGQNLLAVSLPLQATAGGPAISVSRDLAMRSDMIAALNFRGDGKPIWHGPHLIAGDMDFMHFRGQAVWPDLGPEKPAWMRGPLVLSRRTNSAVNGIAPDLSSDHVPGGWGLFAEAHESLCTSSPGPCVIAVSIDNPPLAAITADPRYLVILADGGDARRLAQGAWLEELVEWFVRAGLNSTRLNEFVVGIAVDATRGEVVYRLRDFFRAGRLPD
jgi:hypothetical protein